MFTYSQDALRRALIQIQENGMGVREASREFAVPKTTLQDRLKGKVPEIPMKTGPPPRPRLTVTGENEIVQWLINIAKCGFPIRKIDLISTVQNILKECGKETLFKDGKPGQKWYLNFLKRHPEISLREAETITKARALITEESIRLWFKNLRMYLIQNNCIDILDDPSRIFNGDESGFPLCPKTGKVLGPRGYKNLYKIKTGSDKDNITTAEGDSRKHAAVVGADLEENLRADGCGLMYFSNISPMTSINGHRSHMSLPLSEFCAANKIILYALPPNTTHMLQPADVSVFRPLKQQWKNTIAQWQSKPENVNRSVTKVNFCPIFNEALQSSDMTIAIKNGFKRCGLFPFDPNNVDYTKCVKNTLEQQHAINSRVAENEVIFTHADFRVAEQIIKKIGSNLEAYAINPEVILNEIKFFEDEQMQHSTVSVETFVADAEHAASNISVDPIMDISVIQDVLNEPEIQPVDLDSHLVEPNAAAEPVTAEETTIDSAEPVVDVPEDITTNEHERQTSPASILTESNFSPKTVTVDKPAIYSKEITIVLTKGVINEHLENVSTASTNLAIPYSSPKTTEVEETVPISVTNGVVQSAEETASCSNAHNNEREPLLSLQGAFKQHLVFPAAQDKKKEAKEKLPSAISGEAWREYYAKKENEAKRKLNEKQKRKEERGVKEISDAEEEAERNIGCDFCPRWFHLKCCTELKDLPYSVAAERDYKCDIC
ncbi:hypothetical protein NQ318_023540 [Aromia moschata]|uniref:HTH CENPB-type domain-containing protein n=1 Tax=Aromia moschata TaxID=1265417 RepID=A0AAV8YQZ8_9CUCU|nr:hypothetical protein NQ318_023540 [Aromia moschata]